MTSIIVSIETRIKKLIQFLQNKNRVEIIMIKVIRTLEASKLVNCLVHSLSKKASFAYLVPF